MKHNNLRGEKKNDSAAHAPFIRSPPYRWTGPKSQISRDVDLGSLFIYAVVYKKHRGARQKS